MLAREERGSHRRRFGEQLKLNPVSAARVSTFHISSTSLNWSIPYSPTAEVIARTPFPPALPPL